MSIESIANELWALRERLEAQRSNPHEWPSKEEEYAADLDRYDRRMIKAAAMLGVPAPRPRHDGGFLLTTDERDHLEDQLAAAGLDLRSSEGAPHPGHG